LDTANQKVMAFKTEHNLVNVDESVDGISSRMNALQAALGDATTQQVLLESKLNEHQRLLSKGSYDVLAGMFQNPEMTAMAQAHANITTEASEVLERYGEQHPEYQRARARIRHVDQLMATEVRQNVQGERSQLQTLLSQINDINRELSKVKEELLEKQRLQGSYTELKLDAERTQKIYDSLSARRMEVDLQAQSHLNDVHVVDQAQPPTHPSAPNIPLNLAMALGVGLGGGIGLALLRQRLNNRILSVADLEYFLKTPILGIIPSFPSIKIDNSNRSLYTFSHPRSAQAEAFRSIRTTLNRPYRNKSQRILVTSCQEGEGKSLIATNLAIAYAQMGARVLLVDAQLRHPRIHTIFGVPHSPGLADNFADCFVDQELTRRFPWRNTVARRTHIPRLHILPAGQRSTYPNEVLSSPELERLLRRLDAIYEVVIIDTPPVNNFSDTLALARAADGVLLVLRHGHVPSQIATKVFQQLRQANAKILGIAFNDVPTGLP
jgi:capsular exopolysaccharide synthesis family protein